MKLFEQFSNSKHLVEETRFVKVYRCKIDGKPYQVLFTKKFANRYPTLHCKDNYIFWEQVPVLVNFMGRLHGQIIPIYKFSRDAGEGSVMVIRGKPGGIIGLDDGIFRCADKFDDNCINVMTYHQFKHL